MPVPRTVIRAIMHQTIPLTGERRAGSAIWLAFITRQLFTKLAEFIHKAWDGLREVFAENYVRGATLAGPGTLYESCRCISHR